MCEDVQGVPASRVDDGQSMDLVFEQHPDRVQQRPLRRDEHQRALVIRQLLCCMIGVVVMMVGGGEANRALDVNHNNTILWDH